MLQHVRLWLRVKTSMLGVSGLGRTKRLLVGILVLLLVDVIWVASSELTKYIFSESHFNKPYFTNYLKNCMFIIYLSGFIFWSPWRQQCIKPNMYMELDDENKCDVEQLISDPVYIPVKIDDKNSGTDSDDSSKGSRSVRFSKVSEVRQLAESQAEDAVLARLSYPAYLRAEEQRMRAMSKLPIKYVAKLAFIFCFLYFFANLSYQEALNDTEAGVVNVLSSTAALFTLVLAAFFPSSNLDRFTLSKFLLVLLSIGGVIMVTVADSRLEVRRFPLGCLWALCGAMLYAVYLVLLRRKVDNEDKMDIPMFFGFVGLFTAVLLWPGFFILNHTKAEKFQLPSRMQWLFLVVNGLVGTVISEILWLWGCFLTSSLVGTLSLSLMIPLTMVADTIIKGVSYSWMFYVGSVPVFLAFFGVTLLAHCDNKDLVLIFLKKCLHCICRRRLKIIRLRETDSEQTESLIGINGDAIRDS